MILLITIINNQVEGHENVKISLILADGLNKFSCVEKPMNTSYQNTKACLLQILKERSHAF